MANRSKSPTELKRETFPTLAAEIARQLKKRGLTDAEVLADFETWRKKRRGMRRRR